MQGGGCSGFQYGLMIEESGGVGDQVFESNGVKLFVDPISVSYLKGAEVDFVDTVTGGGFTIKNPNATSTCGCGSSFSVACEAGGWPLALAADTADRSTRCGPAGRQALQQARPASSTCSCGRKGT